MNPMHRDTDRFSWLASVSRALDFGSSARAHAFAPAGPRRNQAIHVATTPALRAAQPVPAFLHASCTFTPFTTVTLVGQRSWSPLLSELLS
jgi:hypothetical protein